MPESPEARRTALLRIDHSQLVDMYIAESALVDKVTGERDRARDLAVQAGAFDGPRVLTTVEELDALKPGAVIVDGQGDAWLRVWADIPEFGRPDNVGWTCATSDFPDTSAIPLHYGGRVTVIHEPVPGGES